MKKCIIILVGLILLNGCKTDPEDDRMEIYRDYLMDSYSAMEGLTIFRSQSDGCSFEFTGKKYSPYSSDPADRTEFLRLAERQGGWIGRRINWQMGVSLAGLAENIVDIDVRSDQAWDAEHPAGSSLKEFFGMHFYSYVEYYKGEKSDPIVSDVHGTLVGLSSDDFEAMLTGPINFGLYSPSSGDRSVPHNLTITVTTETGRTLDAVWVLKPAS